MSEKRRAIHLYLPREVGERMDALREFFGVRTRTAVCELALKALERERESISTGGRHETENPACIVKKGAQEGNAE